MSEVLFKNQDDDAVSEPVNLNGGPIIVTIRADDFGSAIITLESASILDDEPLRFEPLTNGTFTASDDVKIDYLSQSNLLRARISGSDVLTGNILVVVDQ